MKLETESGRSRTYIHELKVRRLPTKLHPHMYPRVRVVLSPPKSYNVTGNHITERRDKNGQKPTCNKTWKWLAS